jgi:hypothetical protein
MTDDLKLRLQAALKQKIPGNEPGYSRRPDSLRPDAMAWAILALQASGVASEELRPARTCLARFQQADGRVSISLEHPEAFWPTPLAILAWQQDPQFRQAQIRAVQFLVNTSGYHYAKKPDDPHAYNPAIKGWSWIDGTCAWIIPSSLAIIALQASGYAHHERVLEACRLLLDRQLPQGGWNYGNTRLFGQELHPLLENTGVALNALRGNVPRQEIEASLTYLRKNAATVLSPISLSWSLLGLGAWGERPDEATSWLAACLRRQKRYGRYDTVALSLLLLVLCEPQGMHAIFDVPKVG